MISPYLRRRIDKIGNSLKEEKQAGVKKGTTLLIEEAAREALAIPGAHPLDYMLAIMRDETQHTRRRLAMAKAALRYCHLRFSPVSLSHHQNCHKSLNSPPKKLRSS
jgi:hypothetical protein